MRFKINERQQIALIAVVAVALIFLINNWVVIVPVFYILFGILSYANINALNKIFKRYINILLFFGALVFSVWVAELTLRAMGKNKTYLEGNQHVISRMVKPLYNSIYCGEPLWGPHEISSDEKVEFTFKRETNSEGFFDKEWLLVSPRKRRIACLGDSFTQGMGASPDSSYPAVLESLLGDTVEVMNCGIAGSDPFYERNRLKRDLLKFKPDIVLFAINSSDVFDVVMRLGEQRFSKNYDQTKRKEPWWLPIYAQSYVFRLIIHQGLGYDWAFMTEQDRVKEEAGAIIELKHNLDRCVELCKANNIQCVFLFTPMRGELTIPMQTEPVEQYAAKQGYSFINARDFFIKAGLNDNNSDKYFWPIDGHNKPAGYALIAKAIRNKIVADSLLIK